MRRKMILPRLLIAVGLFSCLLAPVSARDSKTYKSEFFNFSVEYPADYKAQEMSGIAIFVSPRKDDADTFAENVNIVAESLGQAGVTLDLYIAASKQHLQKSTQNINFLEESKFMLNGLEAYKIKYTSEQNGKALEFMQIFLIHASRAYVITYTALVEAFESYLPDALSIINSFRFL